MRRAVVLALGDPRSLDAGMWVDAVAWLRQELAERDYDVAVLDGEDVERDVARALEDLGPSDDLFVHVSGRLAERGVIRTAGRRRVRLQSIGDVLSARPTGSASIFAELLHDDGPGDALVAAEHVSWIVEAFGARDRGHAMVAAVRAAAASIEGLALTRLYFETARAESLRDVIAAAVHDRVVGAPESLAYAESFTFVQGGAERELVPSPPPERPFVTPIVPPFAPDRTPSFALDDQEHERVERIEPMSLDDRIDAATAAGRWDDVVDLRLERLSTQSTARARVRELVAIARVLQVELGQAEAAIDALEEARAVDPTRTGVLEALERGYERVGRWGDAMDALEALARLSASPAERAGRLHAQAVLTLERLGDPDRAFALLQLALQVDPSHAGALAAFDELCARRAQAPSPSDDDALVVVDIAVEEEPVSPEPVRDDPALEAAPYAAAFAAHRREGRADAAFLAAQALEELGAADADARRLVAELRSVGPMRPRGTLDASAWDLLRAPGSSPAVAAVFAAVARAAIRVRLERLAARKRLVSLDAAARLDGASTASVARSFQWAARVLGVPCPSLYLVDPVPGDIAAVRAPEPSTALGPSVLSGRTAKDLAFLAGRHLTYYRPEHQVLVYFPTTDDLARLFAAAVQLASGRSAARGADRAVDVLRERLAPIVTGAERGAIAVAMRDPGDAHDLAAWTRSVELTAGRAGLLLAGDLAAAARVVRAEARAVAGLCADDRRSDLIAFCASPAHAELRARFAFVAPEVTSPPPAPSATTTSA